MFIDFFRASSKTKISSRGISKGEFQCVFPLEIIFIFITQKGGSRTPGTLPWLRGGRHGSCKDFWVHFATHEHSIWQKLALTGICGFRFTVIQISANIFTADFFLETSKFVRLVSVCIPCRWKTFLCNAGIK